MIEDLKVFHKIYEFIKWLHFLLNKFPKSEKYTMAQKVENISLNVLEGIIQSNNDFDKTASLKKTVVELDKLRIFFRMSKDLQFISFEQYEFGIRQIDEIGRMLGGMLKKFGKTENLATKIDNVQNMVKIPVSKESGSLNKELNLPVNNQGAENNPEVNLKIKQNNQILVFDQEKLIDNKDIDFVIPNNYPEQKRKLHSEECSTEQSSLFRSVSPKPEQTPHFSVEYKTEGFGDFKNNLGNFIVFNKDWVELSFDGRAVYRGGNWNNGANAGPFYANMNNDASNTNDNIGFRCCSSLKFLPDFESLRRFKTDEIEFQFHIMHFETTSIHTEKKVNFNLKVEVKTLALTFYPVSPKLTHITESFGEIQAEMLNIKYQPFAVSNWSFLIENCKCYFFSFMKTHKNLFEKVVLLENLNLAYRKARKGKSKRNEVMNFSYNLEKELINLQRELINQTYNIKGYRDFIIYEPKKREISALPFKDRVVQHAICNIIEPIFEKSFIFDSYACRKKKGTHLGIKRLEKFLQCGNLFALKCDIKKYFSSINHEILKKIIRKKVGDKKLLNLIDKIIDSKNSYRGIPIGNLTSQLFANIFLNELDRFVKHELRAKYYMRYMDDFIILDEKKENLQEHRIKIIKFLKSLDLKMHEKKCNIFPSKNGVDFLGYVVFKNYKRARKCTVKRGLKKLKRKIKLYQQDLIDFSKLMESFNSWEAYMNHGNTYLLKKSLRERYLKNIM